jgi:hypothetical protein
MGPIFIGTVDTLAREAQAPASTFFSVVDQRNKSERSVLYSFLYYIKDVPVQHLLKTTTRSSNDPASRDNTNGFRIVLVPPQ